MSLPWQPFDLPEGVAYWEAAKRGVLSLPWCTNCARAVYYPRTFCPHCHSETNQWKVLSGRGTVYSFGVERRSVAGCDLEPPFVVAIIDLEEGARMVSNVLEPPESLEIGAAVQAVFVAMADGRVVPRFRKLQS